MRQSIRRYFSFVILLPVCAGCDPILPDNIAVPNVADRVAIREVEGATFYTEPDLDDGYWLEVERVRESGTIGGYISNAAHRPSIILMFHGSSTLEQDGSLKKTLAFHHGLGADLRTQDYMTWTLDIRECPTAYGQGDLADALEAIDWLYRNGKAVLGVERVYVAGFSTGGTVATLVGRNRKVDAIIAMAPLTQPKQLKDQWGFYDTLANLFPDNTGMCQLRTTLDFYGLPDSPKWDALDSVAHIDEMKSPLFFIHGTNDIVYYVDNTQAMESRYNERVAAGGALPYMQFEYLFMGDHPSPPNTVSSVKSMLMFLDEFEPK